MAERIERLRELFEQARQRGSDSLRWLQEQCADDPVLAREIQELVERSRQLGDFLEQPLLGEEAMQRILSSTPEPLLRRDDRLGPFRIEVLLGRGGMSEVYLATSDRYSEPVALKVLAIAGADDVDRDRFRREIALAAQVENPHLVRFLEGGEDPERGLIFYAMERVEGETLEQVLQQIRAGATMGADIEALVTRWGCEVGEALAALHRRGLVHRDVKPGNIILRGSTPQDPREGTAVLIDFGLVRPLRQPREFSTLLATPAYAAPEQWLGQEIDARADVYSLGLVLLDLLAAAEGLAPRPGQNLHAALAALATRHAPLAAILRHSTDHDRRWRYSRMRELTADLTLLRQGRRPRGFRPPWSARAFRWLERRSAWTHRWIGRGLAAGVGLFAVIATAAWCHRIYSAGEQFEQHLRGGDLRRMNAALALLPAPADAILLSHPAQAIAASLRQGDPTDPVVRVLAMQDRQGTKEALTMAARLLARDGISRHPALAAFLLPAQFPDVDGERQEQAVRATALLFHDRPDRSPVDRVASQDFRERLHALVVSARDPMVRRWAISALSGCGTSESIPLLCAPLIQPTTADVPETEDVRVTLRAVETIVRRGELLGHGDTPEEPGRALPVAALEEAIRRIPALAAQLPGWLPWSDLQRALAPRAERVPVPEARPDLHLARVLDPPEAERPLEGPHDGDQGLAFWDFEYRGSCLRRSHAQVPTLRAATVEPDERIADASFVQLGLAGLSEVRMPFGVPADQEGVLVLELDVQKNLRRRLPYGGQTWIEIQLDDVVPLQGLMIDLGSPEHFRLVLPRKDPAVAHTSELTVRLHPDSCTSLRLLKVQLRLE